MPTACRSASRSTAARTAAAVFVCEKGKLEINRNKFTSNPPEIAAELLKKVDEAEEEKKWSDQTALWQARWHMQNWLDLHPLPATSRGRRRDRPSLDQRLPPGQPHPPPGPPPEVGPGQEQFLGDDEANQLVNRPRRKGYELPDPV